MPGKVSVIPKTKLEKMSVGKEYIECSFCTLDSPVLKKRVIMINLSSTPIHHTPETV
jgi:hypothetical protein